MKVLPVIVGSLLLSLVPAHAEFLMPTKVPVDRIVKNTEAKLAVKPEDVELRYQLGRVHYLAFSLKCSALRTFSTDKDSNAGDVVPKPLLQSSRDTPLGAEEALVHAGRAAELFQQVLEKKPEHALTHLGLGSLLEQFAAEAAKNPPKEIPPSLAKRDEVTIRKHYAIAFEQAWKTEKSATTQSIHGLLSFVGYEAAQSYLRMAQADAVKLTDEEKAMVRSMQAAVKNYEALPPGPITPLVFSLRPAPSLTALLAPEVAVNFDLRGFGGAERWPWLQGDTAILVWDPKHEGRITSARQMFGSYTWQLFWRDGFAALAALDDDQDGWLGGTELEGLSVWRDRNQNGVSDPGEVVTVSQLGVAGLACAAPQKEGIHPMNRQGVRLADGTVLPLWDWVTKPLSVKSQGSGAARLQAAPTLD